MDEYKVGNDEDGNEEMQRMVSAKKGLKLNSLTFSYNRHDGNVNNGIGTANIAACLCQH